MSVKNKLILEFTEFNAQRLNPDSAQMSIHVDNPQLSINAFDKHEDAIRTGLTRINNILNTLSNSSTYKALKSKLSLEEQQITNLKILRIISNDSVNWDVFISFIIQDTEYFGQIKNINQRNPDFQSEVFKDFDLIQNKEWIIRTKGLILKTIKKWFRPEKGKCEVVNDEVVCYCMELGKPKTLKKGNLVEVETTFDDKIIIKFENEYYTLTNDNFIFFNYWFISKND
jgi:hypothetical protein